MAVELISGHGDDSFAGRTEADNTTTIQEATTAGIHSVQKLMTIISHHQEVDDTSAPQKHPSQLEILANTAMNKFKRVISLLDRPRVGHARFRKAPPTQASITTPSITEQKQNKTEHYSSAFKVYCPTPVSRLPPLPHPVNGGALFSASPPASSANSYMSALTGDNDSVQRSCHSSGFQIIHSHRSSNQGSYMGKPPLCSSSLKRKCNSMDDTNLKCGSSSARCHCSKKRCIFEPPYVF